MSRRPGLWASPPPPRTDRPGDCNSVQPASSARGMSASAHVVTAAGGGLALGARPFHQVFQHLARSFAPVVDAVGYADPAVAAASHV